MCVTEEDDSVMLDRLGDQHMVVRSRRDKYKDWMEFLMLMAAFLTVFGGTLFSVLWWGFRDNIRDEAATFLGTDVIAQQVDTGFKKVDTEMSALKVQVVANADAVKKLVTVRVVQPDPKRSIVFAPCYPGKVCQYQLRVRGTDYGAPCSVPKVVKREVVDIAGTIHPVQPGPSNGPVHKISQHDWTLIPSSFYTPSAAVPGFAEYILTLGYNCPEDGWVEEETVLPFEIGVT